MVLLIWTEQTWSERYNSVRTAVASWIEVCILRMSFLPYPITGLCSPLVTMHSCVMATSFIIFVHLVLGKRALNINKAIKNIHTTVPGSCGFRLSSSKDKSFNIISNLSFKEITDPTKAKKEVYIPTVQGNPSTVKTLPPKRDMIYKKHGKKIGMWCCNEVKVSKYNKFKVQTELPIY